MTTDYSVRYAVHPDDFVHYDTRALRRHFLVENIFVADSVQLTYTHYERLVVGGAFPVSRAVRLDAIDAVKADHFLARRELGVINIGGAGTVTLDGDIVHLDTREALYVGAGTREVTFASADPARPAKFYLNSAPAHKALPSRKIGQDDADVLALGSLATSNERVIRKLLVNSVVETCQLQMGMTELKSGSVWNTMPAHIHDRRMEAYFYFDLPPGQAVCHFMGPEHETRHVWVQNEQAVVSPPWSMHCGAGTSNYIFIWGMAGENLDYDDMDKFQPDQLK